MTARTLRAKVAVAGVGETTYFNHGGAPVSEFKLALTAILAACADAGISPKSIDGFASFGDDRNEAARLATALGLPESAGAWGPFTAEKSRSVQGRTLAEIYREYRRRLDGR